MFLCFILNIIFEHLIRNWESFCLFVDVIYIHNSILVSKDFASKGHCSIVAYFSILEYCAVYVTNQTIKPYLTNGFSHHYHLG